jgi:uncharacterized repeat protein (TIGR03803 family)
LFEVTTGGEFKVLHTFTGSDGASPEGNLIFDGQGNLYGTAEWDGANGYGTVFKLAPDEKLKVLYAFAGGNDGAYPQAGLILDQAGNFYGTTRDGGGNHACPDGNYGCGTVFKLTPDGAETVLYAFTGASDGAEPYGGVVADEAGNLFGTTISGGNEDGLGVVFKLASGGKLTPLHIFAGASDGAWPEAGVILGKTGELYGTAYAEGPDGWGTVFAVRK